MLTTLLRRVPKEVSFTDVRPLSHRIYAALRMMVGAGAAIFVVRYGFKAHYPAWAAMGAMAVMQGAHLHLNMNRALQRMVGTSIGAGVAWLLLSQDPSIWTLIAVIGVFQILTEVFIGVNYALGQMFIAPMALLTVHLATPWISKAALVPERVLDTVVGACLGMVVAVLFSNLDDRRYLINLREPVSRN